MTANARGVQKDADGSTDESDDNDQTSEPVISIISTGDDLRFATTENAPAHADAVLDALRARLPVARYAEGATVATLTDWKLHTLEVNNQ